MSDVSIKLTKKKRKERKKGGGDQRVGCLELGFGGFADHFMGNRWGNSRNSVKLFLGGSKIIADGDCSHEIKRRLLRGRKVMTNLDSKLKSRGITLPTKVCLVKAMVFPVVM